MPISLKSAAGIGGFLRQERLILESGQFVAPFDGAYLVTAIGAGGSGARSPSSGNGLAATGGAAGGLAQKTVRLKAGDVLTLVIGAGGASPSAYGQNGNAGGTTTVTGPGIDLTANGGEGGKTQAAGAGTVAGAVGGTASGGDFNVQGGGSGTATVTSVSGCKAATGGGAVGVYGIGHSSGNASSTAAYTACSGGAGVGGKSGDVTVTGTANSSSSGGSAVASSANNSASGYGPSAVSNLGITGNAGLGARVLTPGGSSTSGITPYPGGGSFGSITNQTANTQGGIFAGSGGSADREPAPGGLGGGSGGNAYGGLGGAGGQGCVVVEWTQEIA